MQRSVVVLLILLLSLLFGCQANSMPDSSGTKEVQPVTSLVQDAPLELTVNLKKTYMDGVTETTTKVETIWSMMDFWAQYKEWEVAEQTLKVITFQRKVNDISPLTKEKGYFGLTEAGELAVFNGLPQEGKLMRSFKPLPIQPLESRTIAPLEKGIKIIDGPHFKQVLANLTEGAQDVS